MAYSVKRVDVWSGTIKDRPGGLAEKLEVLGEAGACLEFVFARRAGHGVGVAFLAPLKGAKQLKAAAAAGLSKTADLQAVRIEGPDKPGLGAKITCALGDAGVSMRGLSAMALGRRCMVYIALDSKKDAAKAQRVLARIF